MTEVVSQSDDPSIKDDLILDALGLLDESDSVAVQQTLRDLPKSEREAALALQAEWATQAPLPMVTPPTHLRAACIASAARAAEQSPEHHLKLTLNRQAQAQHQTARSAAIWRAAALAMFAGMLAMIMLNNQSLTWENLQARAGENQRNVEALEVSPKINGILANRAAKVLIFGQSELGSGQLVWNDSTGDFALLTRGLPKNIATIQIRLGDQVVVEQAYPANNGQFQADAIEQSLLRNTEGQTVTIAFLDQEGTVVLTESISVV